MFKWNMCYVAAQTGKFFLVRGLTSETSASTLSSTKKMENMRKWLEGTHFSSDIRPIYLDVQATTPMVCFSCYLLHIPSK
jgi:hypothetical protein